MDKLPEHRGFCLCIIVLVLASAGVRAEDSIVEVKMADFQYVLSTTAVPPGHVTFKLHNYGGNAHDFEIAGKNSGMISRGATGEFSVDLAPGTYEYQCTVPGHAEAGMKGQLTVRPKG